MLVAVTAALHRAGPRPDRPLGRTGRWDAPAAAARHPDPARRPLQVVAADVRRLGRQIALVPAGAPMARRRALAAAYDDVLIEAAQLLEVPHELTHRAGAGRSARPSGCGCWPTLEDAGLAVHA